jgi:hypothetical protein
MKKVDNRSRVNPSLGGILGTTSRNGQGTKNNQKKFWAFFVKCFHNYNFFIHVYQLHVLIYGLKFMWEFLYFYIAIKMAF